MKLNITKGEATNEHYDIYVGEIQVAKVLRNRIDEEEYEANASLIAEAFNVANETGLTPRELSNSLNRALHTIKEIDAIMEGSDDHNTKTEMIIEEIALFYQQKLKQNNHDNKL